MTCDSCGKEVPFDQVIEVQMSRPSNPFDVVTILAGCADCFTPSSPDDLRRMLSEHVRGDSFSAAATRETWEDFFDSDEARTAGLY